jgi:hypothetical protein
MCAEKRFESRFRRNPLHSHCSSLGPFIHIFYKLHFMCQMARGGNILEEKRAGLHSYWPDILTNSGYSEVGWSEVVGAICY